MEYKALQICAMKSNLVDKLIVFLFFYINFNIEIDFPPYVILY